MPQVNAQRTYRQNKKFYDPILKLPKAPAPKASILLISGCQDNQLSSDGTFNGLFTATLLQVWKDGQFDGNYRKFHKQIVNRMPPDQTPNLFTSGAANSALLASKPFTL